MFKINNVVDIKILAVFTACVEFVSGWQHARNYITTHWADWTWMDRRTKISRISSWKIWQTYISLWPLFLAHPVYVKLPLISNFMTASICLIKTPALSQGPKLDRPCYLVHTHSDLIVKSELEIGNL